MKLLALPLGAFGVALVALPRRVVAVSAAHPWSQARDSWPAGATTASVA